MTIAFLGLGSNLGDRRKNLADAVSALVVTPGVSLTTGSSIYETKPVGVTDQPDFLNLVIQVETSLPPLELLGVCLGIEATLGRKRQERWGPRTIDLDVLIYDQLVLTDEPLVLPHPRMHERSFVITPLAEIVPQLDVNGESVRTIETRLGCAGLKAVEGWEEFSCGLNFRSHSTGEP